MYISKIPYIWYQLFKTADDGPRSKQQIKKHQFKKIHENLARKVSL